MDEQWIAAERYADNGELSHYEIIAAISGVRLCYAETEDGAKAITAAMNRHAFTEEP